MGIDPGMHETGWALVEAADRPRLFDCGLIRTTPRQPLAQRLTWIHRNLSRVLSGLRPTQVALEEMFFIQAAPTVRNTLQARGVIVLAAAQSGCPLFEYSPTQVKMSLTGNGRAKKSQMEGVVFKLLGRRLSPADVADAAAIALCHLKSRRLHQLRVIGRIGHD